MTLVEVFAFLTETMIYRLNRLPEKAFVEFLRLLGVQLQPPSAASTTLRFSRAQAVVPAAEPGGSGDAAAWPAIRIPRGTRVSVDRADGDQEPPEFTTLTDAMLDTAEAHVDVWALHCEQIDGELVGVGSGQAGLSLTVVRPPMLARVHGAVDLVVGVESTLDEIGAAASREFQGKTFRVWREVDHFVELGDDRHVYVVDRLAGRITFAPAISNFQGDNSSRPVALAEIPAKDREIRVWYRRGGGVAGNVASGTLTVMKDPIPGLTVRNPQAAGGGRNQEPLANALQRGPQELHSLRRAVTARDFQQIAAGHGSIARARAFTKAQVWAHAEPGTVQILLVPEVSRTGQAGRLTVQDLEQHQTDDAVDQIVSTLDERRPLGTRMLVNWMRYKVVRVRARIIVFRGENVTEVEARVRRRLEQTISPLPNALRSTGWPFDQPLQVGRVYDAIFKEPGVKDVEQLRLVVDEVPDQPVASIAADGFQPSTWHVISGRQVFRSTDNGRSWERVAALPDLGADEELRRLRTHPGRAGLVALVTRIPGDPAAGRVYVSEDCGETWRSEFRTAFEIYDVAWILRDAKPALLVAATKGLYERAIARGAHLRQLVVGDLPSDLGFWTVAVTTDVRGRPVNVAVAAEESRGVWISYQAGQSKSFVPLGLAQHDIRVLAVQNDGSRPLLWAAAFVVGNQPGTGCFRWGGPNEKWQQVQAGWRGGSCYDLGVSGQHLLAATYSAGVLRLNTMKKAEDLQWQPRELDCGLPRRDEKRPFQSVRTLAVDPEGNVVMTGTDQGVQRSLDQGITYGTASANEFFDSVALPDTMLFCSGRHELNVVDEDAADS